MRNSATDFENWRRKISYQTRNFRNGTRKISGNIDLGCAICKLSSLERTYFKNTLSDMRPVKIGVPQGSILGPQVLSTAL